MRRGPGQGGTGGGSGRARVKGWMENRSSWEVQQTFRTQDTGKRVSTPPGQPQLMLGFIFTLHSSGKADESFIILKLLFIYYSSPVV